MKTVIVIPTYWTWSSERLDGPLEVNFDHPTPLDGESTLPRLLDSLARQERMNFDVLVITAAVSPQLEAAASERVEAIMAPFRSRFSIAQFAAGELQLLRERLGRQGFDPETIGLNGYGQIRNNQLLIPHILEAEVVIALDDDETVAPDYVRRAAAWVGREWRGNFIGGVAGPYLDAGGEWLLPEGKHAGNIFANKAAIMNAAARRLMEPGEALTVSPVAYGGNMVFHRALFSRVGFDPWIARGEDIDYVINARLQGWSFWFDRELTISHLPPQNYQSPVYARLRADVIRFVYEREKLARAGADPAQFDPYPGRFLRDDLETHALAALQEQALEADVARWGLPETIIAQARHRAQETPARYAVFAQTWPRLVDILAADRVLRDYWQARMR